MVMGDQWDLQSIASLLRDDSRNEPVTIARLPVLYDKEGIAIRGSRMGMSTIVCVKPSQETDWRTWNAHASLRTGFMLFGRAILLQPGMDVPGLVVQSKI
jgi:hypothetical protein